MAVVGTWSWGLVACALVAPAVARADDQGTLASPGLRLEDAWPAPPDGPALTLDQQIVDRLTEIGNHAGRHLELLSRETVGLRVDGRGQRAHLRLSTGHTHYLTLQMDEDIHIGDGRARVASRFDLGIGGHEWHLELPDFEMAPTSYQADRGVEVRVPLFERRW